jgi:hypothetical protein
MLHPTRTAVLTSFLLALLSLPLAGQVQQKDSPEAPGWRIEPEKINIQMENDRTLQLLDDSAQELHDAVWSVDDAALATIREEDGRAVLHATAVGTVIVSASWHGEIRTREIRFGRLFDLFQWERLITPRMISVAAALACCRPFQRPTDPIST